MEKTAKEIEKDVFRIMRNSELKGIIKGTFYRAGMRPKTAMTEDVVVKFLTGIDEQEQSGVVLVHLYVPNIPGSIDGELVEDIARVELLEKHLNTLVAQLEDSEYLFSKDGTPHSYPVEGIEQHFINMRLHFRRKTF
ncbi:MAG: hypothetical protein IKU16_06070 [Muribaculaceae bacterium]|nr:hypothetical protein [Muribaculaceae bacterium]